MLLSVKYISDNTPGRKMLSSTLPAGGNFADMAALKGDKEIGDNINKIISKLAMRMAGRLSG